MSIVTKTGDDGTTGLYGGSRVPKSSVRLHAYGTVDELNAVLGLALTEPALPEAIRIQLRFVQHSLFRVGADLATPADQGDKVPRVELKHVEELETWIKTIEPTLPLMRRFILPSGSRAGSFLHLARTICRRAERHVVELMEHENVNPHVQVYLNRLSDALFLAARHVNRHLGDEETPVEY
jgi:cob(I)alamin adenosyltransferase